MTEPKDSYNENLRLQLVACSSAALGNTKASQKKRIEKTSPYWSQAYADICALVDREIALRDQIALWRPIVQAAEAWASTRLIDYPSDTREDPSLVAEWILQGKGPSK